MDGLHTKLTITPFNDPDTVQAGPPSGPPFIAQFNPETFTVSNQYTYQTNEATGKDGKSAKFAAIEPRTFNFDLLLDGTGAAGSELTGDRMDVLGSLNLFKKTVGFKGEEHQPPFLLISWGTFIATCVIETFSVTYKLFRPDGSPLRAILSVSFKEHKSSELIQRLMNLSSPDVTHAHLVKGGEHLSLITHRIYKDPQWYYQVGLVNELNNLRELQSGATITLPPMS